jgi:outer membrane protein assembly factor BamB
MRALILVALLVATSSTLIAENWPQWRGPQLNGVSREADLPFKWDKTTNITWKLALPSWSGATPIIWDNYIFLNVADGDALSLWAVDRTKGEVLWQRPVSGGNNKQRKQNMSSPSPVTDGKRVWVMTGTGILKGFDFSGKELWTRDIQADYGRFGLNWGYASSPLLHENGLYVQVLHGLKIDATTGKTIWKVERPTKAIRESPDSYRTPSLLRYGNTTEIVVAGGDSATGHDPATGKELWRVEGLNPDNNPAYRTVASTVVHGDVVYVPSRERPLVAIKSGGRGDISSSHIIWSTDQGPDVPTPVTDGTHFYIVRDNGVMWCLDAKTGKPVYGPERLKSGTYSSSPVLADGKLYISNEDGVTSVVKAGPKFEILAENALEDYILSSPAVSDGQIFVRTAGYLWTIGNRRTGRATAN